MKRLWGLMLLLVLAGCSAAVPAWETVDDVLPAEPSLSWLDKAYTIQVALPETVRLTEQAEGERLYATEDGDYELYTSVFLASNLDSAIRRLSGLGEQQVTVVETSRFDLPEYQFAWYSETEEGGRLYRADLVQDGQICYALVCSSDEACGNSYEDESRAVFSSFGLFLDEGV